VEAEIWMVAAEARPLAQSGGLADVLRALPDALARQGHAVRRFLPAYGFLDRSSFTPEGPGIPVRVGPALMPAWFLSRREPSGAITTLVENAELFERDGIYGPSGGEYPDNARRFIFFARAVCAWAAQRDRPPAILHVHDWHAALIPLLLWHAYPAARSPRSVLTIHNLGYQGEFGADAAEWISLDAAARQRAGGEGAFLPDGGINILRAGILLADALTTVSPTYAREILTPEFGCALDGDLRHRASSLRGILNGADYELWDPVRDAALPERYDAGSLERKRASARALRERLRLPASERPILGVVSRLVQQKGMDVVLRAVEGLLEAGADLAVLGSGEQAMVDELERLRARHPERLGVYIGYDDPLSHLVIAGSDLLLIPSRYEPCGLTQMYAMRYGTLPVVTPTGGLADTVKDARASGGTGFVMPGLSEEALVATVRHALQARASDPDGWRRLQTAAMAADFSWDLAARRYLEIYAQLLS
jgi:starch synthase